MKASICERYNRSLKIRIYRYLTDKNTRRYIDALQDLVSSYNRRKHRSIGMAPIEVTDERVLEVWNTLYGSLNKSKTRYKLQEGDHVRISMLARPFKKGYLPGWTDEIFKVAQRVPHSPPVYQLTDLMGEPLLGTLNKEELQKVRANEDDYFPIEKVLKTWKRNGVKEYYVKYLNWPEKFSAWTTDVKRVKNLR